ncbi:MAG: alpha/beta hydrolase [Candidatus Binatia bacterium]
MVRDSFRVAAALTLILVAATGRGEARAESSSGGVSVRRDVQYCVAGRTQLTMDVYAPRAVDPPPRPLVIYVHGGGFGRGDKNTSTARAYMAEMVSRGFVGASVNYRLAPSSGFPAMLEDVKCAVRYFRANSSTYRVDPNRIGIMGSSAGGQLASMTGVTDARARFEGSGGYANQSSRVQAVVDLFGFADLTALPRPQRDSLLKVFGSPAGLAAGSPINYVTSDDPPFLIMHGDRDRSVPLSQSEALLQRLRAARVPATLYVVNNADHGFEATGAGPVSPDRDTRLDIIGDFFTRTLRR